MDVGYRIDKDILYIAVEGRIDASNAAAAEEAIFNIKKENPGKKFYPLENNPVCEDMKKITLESVLKSLETMTTPVELPPSLIERARLPIERMLAVK